MAVGAGMFLAVNSGTAEDPIGAPEPPTNPQPPLPVEAYTDQLSYEPGETVSLHVSCQAKSYSVEVTRLGPKPKQFWHKTDLPGVSYPIPYDASANGCRWPVGTTIAIGKDWPSGYYNVAMKSTGPDGKPFQSDAFFVVRPKRPGQSKILLQLSTNTYNAYTNWGGYSLYAYHGRHKVQGRRVSFDRPQRSQFSRWELPFIQWAESNGYELDYCVNSDLEFRPELLQHYPLILSVGHDEYWSKQMRDHLEDTIGKGGNVAFFSGNTCCWQVRTEEDGRALACWKQSFGDDPAYWKEDYENLSTLWGHYLIDRPENSLTGVGFLWGGYHRSHGQFMDDSGMFTVHRPDHWMFADTGLKVGDEFGADLPKYKIVGYECDGCQLTWKDGIPTPTYEDGTPKTFQALATAPARWHPDDCEWYERWEKGRTGNAVLGSYVRGGTVVTVGTTDWSHGLKGGDKAVIQITKNVLDRLGQSNG